MEEWLHSLMPWGTEVLLWIQSISPSWLDPIWLFFTFFANEESYLLMLPFIYWCVHRELGVTLAYLAMLSTWVSNAVKYTFNIPRPTDASLRIPAPEDSPSFLSGHTMSATTNWGYLAVRIRNQAFRIVAAVLIIAISVSRMVLGVHFPQDLVGGFILGLLLLAVYIVAVPLVRRWLATQPVSVHVMLAIVFPMLLLYLHPADPAMGYPEEHAVTTMATLVGLGVGVIMERAWLRFRVDGEWWRRGLRFLVGLIIVVAVYAVPKLLIPDASIYRVGMLIRFGRYALLGWTTAFLCPWLFVRLRLAECEPPASTTSPLVFHNSAL